MTGKREIFLSEKEMALSHSSSSILLSPSFPHLQKSMVRGFRQRSCFIHSAFKYEAAARTPNKGGIHQPVKKSIHKSPRHLITISTADGRFHGQWRCDYVFSLRELQLSDLAEDGQKDADVFINLTVQKHAGFGFSVDGRVMACFNRKCSCCLSSYSREIDTSFDVWVLPSSKNNGLELPEIGGGDPSVIYVKPGSEADLDSLIKDTIRLATYLRTLAQSHVRSLHQFGNIQMEREVMIRDGQGFLRSRMQCHSLGLFNLQMFGLPAYAKS